MKEINSATAVQLRGYCRQTGADIVAASKIEFIMRCSNLEAAQAAVDKFRNAVDGVIGYGDAIQVRFTPR